MDRLIKHKLVLITIAIQLVALPLVLFAVKQRQEVRTQAQKSTTLSFSPASTANAPISKNLGENFSVDVMIDPGTNLISLAKIEISYDPAKVSLAATNPVVVNSAVFPQIVEGPIYSTGKIQVVLSVGPDQTKVVQQVSKALTLNLKAAAVTSQSLITYGTNNQLFSIAPQDSSNENVLSTTVPATIKVNAAPTPTFTPVPTNTPVPTSPPSPTPRPTVTPTFTPTPTPRPPTVTPTFTPSPTPNPTAGPSSTPVPTIGQTVLDFKGLKLHGLGKGGDSPNPNSNGTQNPLHPSRNLTVELYTTTGTLATSFQGTIAYNLTSGDFSGIVQVPSAVTSGSYTVKVKTPQYLRRQIPGFLNLVKGQANSPAATVLIAGDANGDNALTILDYDIIMGCYSDLLPAKSCDPTKKLSADISDDGKVDQDDYNLFLRELSVQQGE